MKILVCIKHVITSESEIIINDSGKWIQYSDSSRFEMNPFDAFAIEEALIIKEKFWDSTIHVITVGPDHAQDTLRRALGMGADEGIHILDNTNRYRPAFLTAQWIAAHAKNNTYDLILTGIMSSDEMNCQTGSMIAQMLSIPCCTAAINVNICSDKKNICVEREIEGGSRDLFDITLPCVLTIQTGINTPRYPSLSKVLRAKKKKFEIIDPNDIKTCQHDLILKKIQYPENKKKGLFLDGAIEKKVDQLIEILEKKELLQAKRQGK